jgi:hypothetical protein
VFPNVRSTSAALTTHNLLILGSATTAKGSIARSIVRLLYENVLALESRSHRIATTVYPIDSPG